MAEVFKMGIGFPKQYTQDIHNKLLSKIQDKFDKKNDKTTQNLTPRGSMIPLKD